MDKEDRKGAAIGALLVVAGLVLLALGLFGDTSCDSQPDCHLVSLVNGKELGLGIGLLILGAWFLRTTVGEWLVDARIRMRAEAERKAPSVVQLWDVAARVARSTLPGRQAAFSPDGRTAAITDGTTIRLWDIESATTTGVLDNEATVGDPKFSPDGKTLAVTMRLDPGMDERWNLTCLWDVATGTPRATVSGTRGLFSPDGATLATVVSHDVHGVQLWDPTTGQPQRLFPAASTVFEVAFSPDSKVLVMYNVTDGWWFWDIATGLPVARFDANNLALSPDGTIVALVTTSISAGLRRTVELRDLAAQHSPRTLTTSLRHGVFRVRFSPDGRTLAVGDWGRALRLWDLATGRQRAKLRSRVKPGWFDLEFSPDSRTLAVVVRPRTVRVLDVVTGRAMARLTCHCQVDELRFSPNGRTLATCGPVIGARRARSLRRGQPS